jgi:hypothetical protein
MILFFQKLGNLLYFFKNYVDNKVSSIFDFYPLIKNRVHG